MLMPGKPSYHRNGLTARRRGAERHDIIHRDRVSVSLPPPRTGSSLLFFHAKTGEKKIPYYVAAAASRLARAIIFRVFTAGETSYRFSLPAATRKENNAGNRMQGRAEREGDGMRIGSAVYEALPHVCRERDAHRCICVISIGFAD